MQRRHFIDTRKPKIAPKPSVQRRRKMRALGLAIAAAVTTTAVLRA